MALWLQFIACTGIILISGTYLSKYGDIIAEKTGLGRTWIGVVLMASVTSLPELVTGISAVALFDLPDIAVGNILGACMLNLLMIPVLDLIGGSAPIATRVHQGHILTAGFGILLLGLVSLSMILGKSLRAMEGSASIFHWHLPRGDAHGLCLRKKTDRRICQRVVSISALMIGAADMAVGNLFGSTVFNIFLLAVGDPFYTPGSLLTHVSDNHLAISVSVILALAIAVIGLIYRTDKKPLFFAWDSLGMAAVDIFTLCFLCTMR
jgi:Ca2+/Na+ antiporter